jgi:NADPH:quinone reductase-like Zn-dependent oxidoreductase
VTLKAAVNTRYGAPDVVQMRDVPKPEPNANEVLIRVCATTVSRTDCGMRRPKPFFVRLFAGLTRPKRTILGMDFAGTVENVGSSVTSYRRGDPVFGLSPITYGAHAEYLCLPENAPMATIPAGIDFDEAVVCEGAWYANSSLRKLNLAQNQKILVYGGSGAIGTAAVQLAANSYGAEVTAVVSTQHLDLVKSLGAHHAVDYTAEDFTQIDKTFDCVLDAVGKTTFFRCRKLLKPTGSFAVTDLGPWSQNVFLALWSRVTGSNRVVFPLPEDAKALVGFVKGCMEAGEIRAVIDRKYPLDEIADAYRYVESGQKTGIVVVKVAPIDGIEDD